MGSFSFEKYGGDSALVRGYLLQLSQWAVLYGRHRYLNLLVPHSIEKLFFSLVRSVTQPGKKRTPPPPTVHHQQLPAIELDPRRED